MTNGVLGWFLGKKQSHNIIFCSDDCGETIMQLLILSGFDGSLCSHGFIMLFAFVCSVVFVVVVVAFL